MTQSFTQNRKKWLIGLSIIVTIFALAGYRYSKSHAQDDVLTIGTLYTTNFTEPLSYQASAFLKLPKFP